MNSKVSFSFKSITPHFIAITIFLVVTIAFYNPLFFKNKSLNQNDVLQGDNAAQEIYEHRELTGGEALWTNSMFGGMPAYLISVDWSNDILYTVEAIISFNMPSSAQVTFLSMLCFYILLCVFKIRPYLAIMGAIAYGLSTFSIISIEAGHIFKVRAMAYMPLVLAGVHLVFHHPKKLLGLGLLSLAVTLEIKANHPQITYYLLLFCLIYGATQLWAVIKEKSYRQFIKNIAIILIAAIVGVGANFGKLWSTLEYTKYSTRGKSELTTTNAGKSGLDREYVFRWSHGIAESFTLLIPDFYGGASVQSLSDNSDLANELSARGMSKAQIRQQIQSVPTYHGDQPSVAGPVYLGSIIMFLFVLGLLFTDLKKTGYILLGTVLFLILSWGKNLESINYLFFDYFPGYNKFRSVSMAMSMVIMLIPLLGFIGLEKLISEGLDKVNQKKFLISLAASAGVCILFILGSGMINYSAPVDSQIGNVPDWFVNAIKSDRKNMLQGDAFRSFILIVLFSTALFFYLKNKISKPIFVVVGLLLITFDLFGVDRRFVNQENFVSSTKQVSIKPTGSDTRILQDKSNYRVLNLLNPWNEAQTSYFHHSIGGYHGAKMKKYQELIDHCLGTEVNEVIQGLRGQQLNMASQNVLNMLNTKYLKFGDQAQNVILNDQSFGNSWFISNVIEVANADEEIENTCSGVTRKTAVVNTSEFALKSSNFINPGNIRLDTYEPGNLKYTSNSNEDGLAVFSEIYYPEGWIVTIDGNPVQMIRANYVLRALEIPAGNHEIEFKFEPRSYFIGNKITMIFSLLVVFGFLGIIVVSIVKK
ncbi:MAG: YfhO family protein [Marinoscillum sp.]